MQIELITIIRTLYNNLQQDQKTLGKISKKTEREEKAKERKGGGKGGGGGGKETEMRISNLHNEEGVT